jgi:primosomal protein N'
MYLVQVIPIISVKTLGNLSYFTSLPINLGDIVEVSINKRKIFAIVVGMSQVGESKLEIRNQDFSLKKINSIAIPGAIPTNIIEVINQAATLVGTNLATLFDIYLPRDFLNTQKLELYVNKDDYKLHFIELARRDSTSNMRQIIRERFARDESVMIIVPTVLSAINLYNELSDGIEDRTYLYHSELTGKQKEKVYAGIASKKPTCIISTPNLIGMYAHRVRSIIIHEEESKYYDHTIEEVISRDAFMYIARELGFDTTLTARHPSLNSYYIANQDQSRKHILAQNYFNNKILLAKMNDIDKKPFSLYLSYELKLLMERNISENKNVVLYTQRKGMSSSSVCMDCGESIKCETCDNDLCLFEDVKSGDRYYRCLICKTKTKLEKEIVCKVCTGMRIATLGIGTQGLAEHLHTLYPDTPIHILDGDHIKTKKDAIKKYSEWKTAGGILIGTEMMLPLLEHIDLIGIVSLDTYFSLPEYSTDEEIMQTISTLLFSLKESGSLVVQTRHKSALWEFVTSNSLIKYYEYEIQNRHSTNLPPFTYMISFDLPDGASTPEFLDDKKFEYYNIRGRNFIRHIYLIPRETWYSDPRLRQIVTDNLLTYHLRVNQRSVLKGL